MKREFSEWPCSLARAVDVFGDSWTLLIVRDALQGLKRFDEFQGSLNVARNTLSDRLGKLVDAGVMTKRFYQDNPPRYEYLLTEMGRDFFPVLASMLAWGDKWLDDGGGAPVTLHHHQPGHKIASQVICVECGEPVEHADIQFCVGPGYPDDVRPELDIRGRLAPAPVQSAGRPGRDTQASPTTAAKAPRGSTRRGSGVAKRAGTDTRASGDGVNPGNRATAKRTRPTQPNSRAG
jgi:DNA-binding HxlR family transcriptional regulator